MSSSKPLLNSSTLFGITTLPQSPTIILLSPTSVTTQGTLQLIASAIELLKPSPKEEEEAISNPL